MVTNPLGLPPSVSAGLRSLDFSQMHHYSHPAELPGLMDMLALHSGVPKESIMLTAGADQAIELALTHILAKGHSLGILTPTFSRFEIVGRELCCANIQLFESLADAPSDCKAIVLCTPNNPTGNEIPIASIEHLIRSQPKTFFLIDSVLSSFGTQDTSTMVNKFPNVAVLKSLSKSFGLADFRVGWIESQEHNIAAFSKGISPFRVAGISQMAALFALRDKGHLPDTLSFLEHEFDRIQSALGEGLVRGSNVPFFLFKTENPQETREWLLEEHEISVVDSTNFTGSKEGFLRIAIGMEGQNDAAIAALSELKTSNTSARPSSAK
jgi:histidinol-phosphate aminotransferase